MADSLPWVDLTITNPPFDLALDFLRKSILESTCTLLLLRLGFLASGDRKAFLSENRPTHVYVLSKRPSFVDVCKGFTEKRKGGVIVSPKVKGCGAAYQKKDQVKTCDNCGGNVSAGTDACDYAWMAWDYGYIMLDDPGVYFL